LDTAQVVRASPPLIKNNNKRIKKYKEQVDESECDPLGFRAVGQRGHCLNSGRYTAASEK